jgi:hypothetical protein
MPLMARCRRLGTSGLFLAGRRVYSRKSQGPTDYRSDDIKIYVINLDRRRDRLERMQAIADALGFEFERVSAVDAKSDDFHHPNAPAQVCPPR